MIYTIAHMEECCKDEGNMNLELEVHGNKYCVAYGKTGAWTRRKFDSLTEAYKVFEKLASWMVFSLYPEQYRRQYLTTGKMD